MTNKYNLLSSVPVPTCVGTGFVALDIVINKNVKSTPKLWTGGSCGNVLTILSYLGWESYPIARLGRDAAAENIKLDLGKFQVKLNFIDMDDKSKTPIIVEQIYMGANGKPKHQFKLQCPSCGSWFPRYRTILTKKVSELLNDVSRVQTFYFDRVSPASLKLANEFRNRGALVVFEPSSIGNEKLFHSAISACHILKYSSERLGHINFLSHKVLPPLQIETLGSDGVKYRLRNSDRFPEWSTIPAFNIKNIKDTAGSGDWCTAGIIHILGRNEITEYDGFSEEMITEALKFGQALAALNCCFEGARGGMYILSKEDFRKNIERIMFGDSNLYPVHQTDIQELNSELDYICPFCSARIGIA